MSFVTVTKGNPAKATGTKKIALVFALRELQGGGWMPRAGVEKAMAEASTLAIRTCRNHLRDWTNYGLLATDTGYTASKGYARPPRVALTVLGRAWAIENALLRAPVWEGVSENRRSEAPSGRVSDKHAGQGTRSGVSLQEGGVSDPPPSDGRAVVCDPLEGQGSSTTNGHNDGRQELEAFRLRGKELCEEELCDRDLGHPGNHMVWNADGGSRGRGGWELGPWTHPDYHTLAPSTPVLATPALPTPAPAPALPDTFSYCTVCLMVTSADNHCGSHTFTGPYAVAVGMRDRKVKERDAAYWAAKATQPSTFRSPFRETTDGAAV